MVNSSFTAITTQTSVSRHAPRFVRETSSRLVNVSLQLAELEEQRQDLKRQLDGLAIVLAAAQHEPSPQLSEEQGQQLLTESDDWEKELNSLAKKITLLDRDITYYNDYNEDLQLRLRDKSKMLARKNDEIIEQKIKLILNHLKTDNADLRIALKKTLNDPILQEAYLEQLGQPLSKSFTDKLKGLFKKGES